MDRLAQLSLDLTALLAEIRDEANRRELTQMAAPLSWLDEANGWLNYELATAQSPSHGEPVAFTFVPTHLRR